MNVITRSWTLLAASLFCTVAAPAQAPATPATLPIASPNQPGLCDNLNALYPQYNPSRLWLSRLEQRDYPTVVFDAQTNLAYWFDPSLPGTATQPQVQLIGRHGFAPVTYTAEKILVVQCHVPFDMTPGTGFTSVVVPVGDVKEDDASVIASDAAAEVKPSMARPTPCDADQKARIEALTKKLVEDTTTLGNVPDRLATAGSVSISFTEQGGAVVQADLRDPRLDGKSGTELYHLQLADMTDLSAVLAEEKNTITSLRDGDRAAYRKLRSELNNSGADCAAEGDADLRQTKARFEDALKKAWITVHKHVAAFRYLQRSLTTDTVDIVPVAKGNSLLRIAFTLKSTDTKPDNSHPAPPSETPHVAFAPLVTSDAKAVEAEGVPLPEERAVVLVERHHMFHFAPSGGFLALRSTPVTYTVVETPNVVTTTTVVSAGPATPPPILYSPVSTTVQVQPGSASFLFAAKGSPMQQTAVAGITWYFWGRDSYPITSVNPNGVRLHTYASTGARYIRQGAGLFLGTSVSDLGTFVIAPTFEIRTGIQLFAGLTLHNRTQLAAGITPCSSYGPSTVSESPVASVAVANGLSTQTVVSTSTAYGCTNAADATRFASGAKSPTIDKMVPAFGFGILFDSTLLKYLKLKP